MLQSQFYQEINIDWEGAYVINYFIARNLYVTF